MSRTEPNPGDLLIQRLRGMAAEHPSAIALQTQEFEISYHDLLDFAETIAQMIREAGVRPGDLVVVPGWRHIDGVTATVAVILAGAAYLPIDAYLTAPYTQSLLRVAMPKLCVWPCDGPPAPFEPVLHIDIARGRVPRAMRKKFDTVENLESLENLAYAMFTSGTTGSPKLVGIRRRSILNLVCGQTYARFGPDEAVLFGSSPTFDASTFELWAPLLHGGRLVLAPPQILTGAEFGSLANEYGITTAWLTAPLFEVMVNTHRHGLGTLRQLLTGGDVVDVGSAKRFLEAYPRCILINGYGPTETTTFALTARIAPADLEKDELPIGLPLQGVSVDLVSPGGPVNDGEQGELWISGLGVGTYLGASSTTPGFCVSGKGPTFRTGDWGVRDDLSGAIHFIGRRDRQVKIRGRRIELDAVERAVRRLPGVESAAVLSVGDKASAKRMVAFVSSTSTKSWRAWQTGLAAELPDWLIPTHWRILPALPLSRSGKIDRALLDTLARQFLPTPSTIPEFDPSAPPGIAVIEQVVSRLWEQVLGVAPLTTDDDFFGAGGDSLAAVSLLTAIEQATGINLPMSVLYQGRTFGALLAAAQLSRKELWSALVALHQSTVSIPERILFAIHGLNGDVFNLHRLADALPTTWQVWGFRGLSDYQARVPSVAAMAEAYVRIAQWTRPQGPCALLGYSAGGIVALKMAESLDARGVPVSVVLLDVDPPRHWAGTAERGGQEMRNGPQSPGAQAMAELPSLGPYTQRRVQFMEEFYAAVLAQGPIRVPVPVWALRTKDALPPHVLDSGVEMSWHVFLPHFLGTRLVPGDHQSFLRPPHVEGVAQALADCLMETT